jgi:Polysaccharide lyase 14
MAMRLVSHISLRRSATVIGVILLAGGVTACGQSIVLLSGELVPDTAPHHGVVAPFVTPAPDLGASSPASTPSIDPTATPGSTAPAAAIQGGTPHPPPTASTPRPTAKPVPTPTPLPHPTSSGSLAGFFAPAFRGAPFCTFSQQNAAISGGVLTVTYPAGSTAPSAGPPYGGAQICIPFAGGSRTDATLSYRVRFPVGFQFVKGGKLPGMYGGVEPFSGGGHNAYGWSMRLMWRAGGAAEVYGYISTTTNGYGDDWGRGNFSFQADGQWHSLTEHIHLNTPGHSDGYVTLAYDGTVRIDQTGLAITTMGTPIGGLFFSTFYGGHDSSWAPTANEHIDFAGFTA